MRKFRFEKPALVLGVIVLGYGAVATADCTPTPCDEAPKSHTLTVADQVSCKNPHLSKQNANVISWCSAEGTNLNLVFESPTPFPGLTCKKPNQCKSGPISKDIAPGTYKYHAFLNGKEIDPNVIIDH
ncbi:MAG TPA: hypothetical protein VKH46_02330 [Thermoanaerobaculia bacterium]|nr:hypothetical protein [Thermoanaerobaculia bacterium]